MLQAGIVIATDKTGCLLECSINENKAAEAAEHWNRRLGAFQGSISLPWAAPRKPVRLHYGGNSTLEIDISKKQGAAAGQRAPRLDSGNNSPWQSVAAHTPAHDGERPFHRLRLIQLCQDEAHHVLLRGRRRAKFMSAVLRNHPAGSADR